VIRPIRQAAIFHHYNPEHAKVHNKRAGTKPRELSHMSYLFDSLRHVTGQGRLKSTSHSPTAA
ncbi:MAG: hypothetical protein WBJ19_01625, partial [Rhodoferax sp.]